MNHSLGNHLWNTYMTSAEDIIQQTSFSTATPLIWNSLPPVPLN